MSQSRSVLQSVRTVGGFTLLSRGLGLVRDMLMAAAFGTSLPMSAFVVAFTIPNLFRRLFGEGALSAAFVPVFLQVRSDESEAAAWALARKVRSLLSVTLILLVVAGIGAAGAMRLLAAPGSRLAGILPLLQIMLPYMFFICLAALSMATLNALRRFAVPAAAPCLLNIVWIATLLITAPLEMEAPLRIRAVAWAVVLAGMLQLAVQWPLLFRLGYRPRFQPDWRDRRVLRVLRLMGPAALGMALTQFNVIIDRLLAMFIGEAAPAALYFSERLVYFPLGIFGTALATVLLPTFSQHAAGTDQSAYRRTLHDGLNHILAIMTPAALGILVLARPIVEMVFGWGLFGDASATLTSVALRFYAPGLLIFAAAKVLVPAFYGLQDTRTPVRVALWSMALNLVLNIVFILTWPQHLKHGGLALATVLSETFNAVVLGILLHRRLGDPGWRSIASTAVRVLLAAVVMAAGATMLHRLLLPLCAGLPPLAIRLAPVILAMAGGTAIYAIMARLLRIQALREVLQALLSR